MFVKFLLVKIVSIHTPTKGVTDCLCLQRKAKLVSIHTPTKGVTEQVTHIDTNQQVSIHTPTKGVTNDLQGYSNYCEFQSTHPRRV